MIREPHPQQNWGNMTHQLLNIHLMLSVPELWWVLRPLTGPWGNLTYPTRFHQFNPICTRVRRMAHPMNEELRTQEGSTPEDHEQFRQTWDIAQEPNSSWFQFDVSLPADRRVEEEGQQVLRFQLLDSNHPSFQDQTLEVKDFECKEVKSSSGEKELRYVIRTRMRLFGKLYRTKFSLTNREEMRNPVLIGRKFLSNRFLVDVKKENLSYMRKNSSS